MASNFNAETPKHVPTLLPLSILINAPREICKPNRKSKTEPHPFKAKL